MLSKETEQKLVQLFITISIGEEKMSKLKENIISNININPIKLFYKLDINNVGCLSKNDIYSYLNYYSINFYRNDIDYIFYFYDKDNDDVLSFYEFIDLIIPNSNYLYKRTFKKKYKYNKYNPKEINEEMDINVEKCFLEIIMEEINLARNLNDLIINLKHSKDFVIQDVFYEIKSYSYITNDSLKAFFDRNEVNYNDKFIKNIFNRFDNKEINGKISFNKFKNFFDLPYNKNIKNNNIYIEKNNPSTINQTFVSGDIKFNSSNSNTNFGNSNLNQQYQNNYNNNYNYNNYCYINSDNYINEEDIQFQCSHLSRSGSIESNEDRNKNFKYIPKNKNRNNLYKNYLREKRSKSLEKSLSKSLSRGSEPYSKIDKRNIIGNNPNNMRDRQPFSDDYNNNDSFNEGYNINRSGSSYNEDLPTKLPVRLDKNLVRRKLPERKNMNQNNKINFNFCYDNEFDDINTNNHNQVSNSIINEDYSPQQNYHYHHHHRNHSDFYTNHNMVNFEREIESSYNDGLFFQRRKYDNENDNDRFISNNLDLKMYQEDVSNEFNNRRY